MTLETDAKGKESKNIHWNAGLCGPELAHFIRADLIAMINFETCASD